MTKDERLRLKSMFGGRCAYCGAKLGERWHVDHVAPKMRGTREEKETALLYPACPPCNLDKAQMLLEVWRDYLHYRIVHGLRRNSPTFRAAERFGKAVLDPSPLVFFFETYPKEKL